ncbi:MAG TPA: 30S ribosomal protein S19e [Candidatus Nanoarchaeia archaeon]|nr:30S ribosomal protein S19e [Candidatus Nanoarchaeia archaeon]
MASVYDANPNELVEKAAGELKKVIKAPDWSRYVKTGVHKERPPADLDWWYKRAAAVLRKVYILGPVGTNKLRAKYGGKKNRGYKPEKFFRGSGKIIRTILQQLESEKLIVQQQKGLHKGRVVTAKGKKLLDTLSKK